MIPERLERIAEMIKTEVSDIILNRIRDQRVGFVTVTRTEVTRDLQHCRVFVSVMGSDEVKKKGIKGLASASGYIRKLLGERIKIRYVPELTFILDESVDYSFRIEGILNQIKDEKEKKDELGETTPDPEKT